MMIIQLHANKTLKEIQSEFSSLFPYLKIEFFPKTAGTGKGVKKEYLKNLHVTLQELTKKQVDDQLILDENTIVNELEKQFRERFDLNVQVFRKSGNIWLETTATNNWTLGYQNSQGQELDKANLSANDSDYHEQH
ncbi:MAG TPA: hypothetical protein VIK71_10165 [Flavobacteriales bacterium]|jgi:hypothetical protein